MKINRTYYDGRVQCYKTRARWLAVTYAVFCNLLGHKRIDESEPAQLFDYQSTSLDDGTVSQHSGATQQCRWVYCGRCGQVLESGLYFEGFVIPGRSSVP